MYHEHPKLLPNKNHFYILKKGKHVHFLKVTACRSWNFKQELMGEERKKKKFGTGELHSQL